MKGYKYTIKVENYDTNENYVDFQIYSAEYSDLEIGRFGTRVNKIEKELKEAEMSYDRTIYGRKDDNGEFLTYTYTIYKRD